MRLASLEFRHARMAQAVDHAAHTGKRLYILLKFRAVDGTGVQPGQTVGNSPLVQVIAQAQFAAKGVPPMGKIQLAKVVIAGLNQHRYVQPRQADGLSHAQLFPEIGQDAQDAVDLVGMGPKQPGTGLCLLEGSYRSILGLLSGYHNNSISQFFQQRRHLLTGGVNEMGGEKTARGNDHTKSLFSHNCVIFFPL